MGFGVNFFLIFGMGSLATTIGGWMADNSGVDRFYAVLALIAFTGIFTAMAVYPLRIYGVKLKSAEGKWQFSIKQISE